MTDSDIFKHVPGGLELLEWFGKTPSFHDGEITRLDLRRRAASSLSIHTWNTTSAVDSGGYLVQEKHAVVTFEMHDLVDLQLDGFSQQNVIGGLKLSRGPIREERARYCDGPSDEDYEIELEPCFGLDGRIRCRSLIVRYEPGTPQDFQPWPK